MRKEGRYQSLNKISWKRSSKDIVHSSLLQDPKSEFDGRNFLFFWHRYIKYRLFCTYVHCRMLWAKNNRGRRDILSSPPCFPNLNDSCGQFGFVCSDFQPLTDWLLTTSICINPQQPVPLQAISVGARNKLRATIKSCSITTMPLNLKRTRTCHAERWP